MLDLGTVVGQEHDSRDLFEKVFQRLDADASLDVTRAEFKRYFCPLDHLRPTTTKTTNDEASPGKGKGSPSRGGSPSARLEGKEAASRSSPYASPSASPSANDRSRHDSRHSPRVSPGVGRSSVSVFSQASGSVQDDYPPSPPMPAGGCCGIGAKKTRARAPPRAPPPRAAAYRAPGASPLAASTPTPSSPSSGRVETPKRSPPKPFRVPSAREGDGATPSGTAREVSVAAAARSPPSRSPPSPLRAPSPLAPRRADANVVRESAAEKAAGPPPAGFSNSEPKVVEKVVEKKVYNISDEELASLKEELELLRERVRSEGETLRSKDARLGEMEKENTALRAEYNLQSLKQDMLVHMWSMHMLDADVEDDAST